MQDSSILYKSKDGSFLLLDLPLSIALAQATDPKSTRPSRDIISYPPQEEPFPTTEPKSDTARANIRARSSIEAQERDDEYRQLIREGLKTIRKEHKGSFALPRSTNETLIGEHHGRNTKEGKKRKRSHSTIQNGAIDTAMVKPQELNVNKVSEPELRDIAAAHSDSKLSTFLTPLALQLLPTADSTHPIHSLNNRPLLNPSSTSSTTLSLSHFPPPSSSSKPALNPSSSNFHIPPLSTSITTHLTPTNTIPILTSLAITSPSPTTTSSPRNLSNLSIPPFTHLILDPPWPNRSVRRSKHYTTASKTKSPHSPHANHPMNSTEDLNDPNNPLAPLLPHIQSFLAPDAIVAIWITHRESVRAQALAAFQAWDVELVEEWVWAKITMKGELVYDIQGLWRRGWEVVLVGRRRGGEGVGSSAAEESGDGGMERREHNVNANRNRGGEVRRTLICAVPDVHSRKPCLKEVFREWLGLGAEGKEERVLEVFARHLVAGWWSVGDEVLRFQWEGWWVDGEAEPIKRGEGESIEEGTGESTEESEER